MIWILVVCLAILLICVGYVIKMDMDADIWTDDATELERKLMRKALDKRSK